MSSITLGRTERCCGGEKGPSLSRALSSSFALPTSEPAHKKSNVTSSRDKSRGMVTKQISDSQVPQATDFDMFGSGKVVVIKS